MVAFFDLTLEALAALDRIIDDKLPEAQRLLVEHDKHLHHLDRGAHQQQIAGSKVLLQVAQQRLEKLDARSKLRMRIIPSSASLVGAAPNCVCMLMKRRLIELRNP